MQIEGGESDGDQLRVDLGRETTAVHGGQQRYTGLTLAMFVARPAQHEVADQLTTVAQHYGDRQHVVFDDLRWLADLFLEDVACRLAITDAPVEVARDALVGVD